MKKLTFSDLFADMKLAIIIGLALFLIPWLHFLVVGGDSLSSVLLWSVVAGAGTFLAVLVLNQLPTKAALFVILGFILAAYMIPVDGPAIDRYTSAETPVTVNDTDVVSQSETSDAVAPDTVVEDREIPQSAD